jgi:hypothetical protein
MAEHNSNNFYNSVRGVLGLFGTTNKTRKPEDEGDAEQQLLPEFESKLSDEQIIKLSAQWTSEYEVYAKEIKQQQKDNVNYWIGKHFNEFQTAGTKKPLVDNLLFEAIETFLPIATRGNPQAIVTSNGTPEGDQVAKTMTNALEYQANRQHLRMKLKGVTRDWALYLVGCTKIIWDTQEDDIDTLKVLPTRLILDPHSTIEVGGVYKGDYLGEKKKASAAKLIKMFPKKKAEINAASQGMKGTKLNYTEWWTPTDLFFTLGEGTVLGKYKNPHWNYTGPVTTQDPVTGEPKQEVVEGINHFTSPQIPYIFLTIFNLGKRPHDETSLVQQNIPLQDLINRRYQQIDKNVDSQNNGIVLSGSSFTKEQAAEASTQLARGNSLWVPDGDINKAYKRDQAPALAPNVFQQLQDARQELRNIFGTAGSNVQSLNQQDTVRGKIMVNQMDSSRIGGGVTEYIEQMAQTCYNWYVQMMYVYYTEEHSFSVSGAKASELMTIKNTDLSIQLHVTVKDGSLIPKDPLTKRNEAMDLWSAGALAPIPLFTALDYPNPYESAKELVLWKMIEKGAIPPEVMFPDLQGAQPGAMPNPTPGISAEEGQRSINPDQPDTIAQDSRQLLQSVPIQ